MTVDPFYLYLHTDPVTREVVYVGRGCKNRAWTINPSNRSDEHNEWYLEHEKQGRTMDEIVTIYSKNLSLKEVEDLEYECIKRFNPRFNKRRGKVKLSNEKIEKATQMLKSGKPLGFVAKEFNMSTVQLNVALGR